MDAGTRHFMENRMGQDFSQVRVHTDGRAAESAAAIQARAFTSGWEVVFGAGEYQPGSDSGKRLLAHELVHVGQQQGQQPLQIQRMTRTDAFDYGRNLHTRYPGWLTSIPNCPCTIGDARASSEFREASGLHGLVNPLILDWYHPGASSEVRSTRGYQTLPGTNHGQQCTYDSAGNLITEGAGAGTPDVWSAYTNNSEHRTYDVETFGHLGWQLYTQFWTPNNGNSCAPNSGGGRRNPHVPIPAHIQDKIVRIQNHLDGFFHSAAQIRAIIDIVHEVTNAADMAILRQVVSPMLTRLLDIGDRTTIRVEMSRR